MSKVVVCISGNTLEECLVQAAGKYSAELRLDLVNLTRNEIDQLWQNCEEWVLTLRKEFTQQKDWKKTFKYALSLNPVLVDIDSELPEAIKNEVKEWVTASSAELMLSYHNFKETPTLNDLLATIDRLKLEGAAVVKMACMAQEEDDNLTIMELYKSCPRLVAFCMGEEGRESRVAALFFGEKMTYAAPSEEYVIAPGQLTYGQLSDMLNLGFDDE